MKIRIFALAKELDLDSKDLIQACTEVGLTVKSSPLASISPEERDMVLAHIKSRKAGGPAKAAKAAEAPVLSREPVPERTKLKPIRTLGTPVAKTGTRRPEDQDELSSPEEVAAPEPTLEPVEAVAVAPEPAPAPEIKTAPVLEKKPAKAKVEPVAPPPVVEAPVSETSAESEDDPGTAAAHAVPEKPAAPATAEAPAAPAAVPPASRSRITPMSRPEQPSPLREMKPVGSVRDMAPRGTMPARTAEPPISRDRDKGARRGPALPTMAMPSFKAPSPTKAEGPVQKPDLKLTGEMLRDSGKGKIADIMRKNKEAGTKRKPGDPLPTAESARAGKLPTGGMEEIREARRQKRTKTRGSDELDAQEIIRQKRNRKSISAELKTEATVTLPITMRGLSELLGRPVSKLMGLAMKSGKMVAINDSVDEEIVLEIGMEFGIDIKIVREDDVETELKAWLDRPNEDFGVPLIERAPIVTILGHVDHGKTTLVDTIRKSNVAAGEAGGITQHIAAYQVEHHGKKLTFVDTPGHAAFSQMRARGANVTDIVVLVVAANDGVMPQTIECISHARAAGVPIVVALNKIDLPGINEQKVLTELSQQGLYPTEWGGDTEVVRISGLTGDGVDNLLETLLLTAELNNYTAPADIPADGVCLESFRDEGRGPMAWCMVRRGTLKIGDTLLCGSAYGRVRAMYNDKGQEVREAGPSTPVKVAGLSDVPGTGYHFFAVDDLDLAVQVAEERKQKGRFDMLSSRGGPKTLEQYFAEKEGNLRELPLVVKADTQGSIEAIRFELNKFDHAEVKIRILHEAVGGVNESDVYLAASSGAIVVAFGVIPDDNAVALASKEGVEIRRYSIIYNVADDIRNALEGLLAPEVVSVQTGRAIVLRTFVISKAGVIAGCRVLSGLIERSNRVNVIREQKVLNSYNIASLKREKEDVREVRDGLECGIRLEGFNDVKEGDLLECFRIEERKRTLDE
ncbi:MAG: translation initiation factor IF-2 [Planctomycetota bacterium]|nr:MAG: translation initiation factor IF-2 [Planctomycetota bacterium]